MSERKENNQGCVEGVYKLAKSAIYEISTYARRLREFATTHEGQETIILGTTVLLLPLGFFSIAARGDLKLIMLAVAGVALPTASVVGIGLFVQHVQHKNSAKPPE